MGSIVRGNNSDVYKELGLEPNNGIEKKMNESLSKNRNDTSNDGLVVERKMDEDVVAERNKRVMKMKWSTLFIWFLILAVIFWIILYAWKPESLQKKNERDIPTGEVNAGAVLLVSIIIAILISLIIFVLFAWF